MCNARETYPEELLIVPLASVDLKHLVIKLRWIGMEAEAEWLRRRLDRAAPGEITALWPQSTD